MSAEGWLSPLIPQINCCVTLDCNEYLDTTLEFSFPLGKSDPAILYTIAIVYLFLLFVYICFSWLWVDIGT